MRRFLGVLLFVTACSMPTQTPTAVPPSHVASSSASQAATATECNPSLSTVLHQAPELEALLPSSVAGRPLATWSLRGACWLGVSGVPAADLDDFLVNFETADSPRGIDLANLIYGVAGRSDTEADPPFLVFGAARPYDDDEIYLAQVLLFAGAGFANPAIAGDLRSYEETTVSGKQVYVGTSAMLTQSQHQRGRPFLYQTDEFMFVVVTEDDDWAADALRQLP